METTSITSHERKLKIDDNGHLEIETSLFPTRGKELRQGDNLTLTK